MVVLLVVLLVSTGIVCVLGLLALAIWRRRAAARAAAAGTSKSQPGSAPASHSGGAGGSGGVVLNIGAAAAAAGMQYPVLPPGLLAHDISGPVYDSSDSFHVQDRVALTQELARLSRQLEPAAQMRGGRGAAGSSSDGSSDGSDRQQRLPPAAAAGGISATSAASDACLQRLQSAITSMSQDVLSRRLQYALGADGSPLVMGMGDGGGELARPSPMGQQAGGASPRLSGPLLARTSHRSNASSGLLAEQQQLEGSGGSAAAAAVAGCSAGRLARLSPAARIPSQGAGAAIWTAGAPPGAAGAAAASVGSMRSAGSSSGAGSGIESLKLLQLIGQGTFGQVYKALWRRRCVAVKVLQLPVTSGSSDMPWRGVGRVTSHREKMAVMETVVSTTMRWVVCVGGWVRRVWRCSLPHAALLTHPVVHVPLLLLLLHCPCCPAPLQSSQHCAGVHLCGGAAHARHADSRQEERQAAAAAAADAAARAAATAAAG
jgi:hypothetical protein